MATKTKLSKLVLDQVRLYVARVKSAKIPVEKVIVFGSHAKGTTHKWSDIDVCIVSPQFGKNGFDELVKLSQLRDDSTIDIEAHPMNPRDLMNKYDTLASEIRKYGIDVLL
jgi:predicted nucleotidyltransferase